MKSSGPIMVVFSIITAVYVGLSLALTKEKSSVFWVGFGFVILAVIIMAAITLMSTKKRTSAFPFEISAIVFSGIYAAVVFCINILCGYALNAPLNAFICVHLICFALFAVTILLMFLAKSSVMRQNQAVNRKIFERQNLIFGFERIKTKLIDMQDEPRRQAIAIIDSLLDELRLSDLGIETDVSGIDSKLRSQIEVLSSEVDNLIAIKSTDLTGIEMMVNDIKKIIRDRNMQIRLMSSNI